MTKKRKVVIGVGVGLVALVAFIAWRVVETRQVRRAEAAVADSIRSDSLRVLDSARTSRAERIRQARVALGECTPVAPSHWCSSDTSVVWVVGDSTFRFAENITRSTLVKLCSDRELASLKIQPTGPRKYILGSAPDYNFPGCIFISILPYPGSISLAGLP